ncbi:unnamed protein product, partial [Prorocentrum cordatum]
DATSGPVYSSLRGAIGNSSRKALLGAGSAPCGASSRVGKNSHGTNLRQAAWSNVAEDCCNQCNGDSDCHAWTWIDGSHECWLKASVPDESQWTSEDGVTSGLSSEDTAPHFLGAAASSGSWTFYDNEYITADCKIPTDGSTSDFKGFSGKVSEAKRMCEAMSDCVGLTGGRDAGERVDDEYTMFVYFMSCNDVRTNNEGWISHGL